MPEEKKPLFPDTIKPYRKECWNCGKLGLVDVGTRYKCSCGCGWTNRYGVNEESERASKELRDRAHARAGKYELVDFTSPDAPSSPA